MLYWLSEHQLFNKKFFAFHSFSLQSDMFGWLAQLVRALLWHGRGQWFESTITHHLNPTTVFVLRGQWFGSKWDSLTFRLSPTIFYLPWPLPLEMPFKAFLRPQVRESTITHHFDFKIPPCEGFFIRILSISWHHKNIFTVLVLAG